MPQKLTDPQIEIVCREVLARESAPSGRSLRRALRERYGASGRTDRVFGVWRRMSGRGEGIAGNAVINSERQQWSARIGAAEERARLAEERETLHQDRWASEVYALREQLRARHGGVVSGVSHEAYRKVHLELAQVRGELERLKQETGRS